MSGHDDFVIKYGLILGEQFCTKQSCKKFGLSMNVIHHFKELFFNDELHCIKKKRNKKFINWLNKLLAAVSHDSLKNCKRGIPNKEMKSLLKNIIFFVKKNQSIKPSNNSATGCHFREFTETTAWDTTISTAHILLLQLTQFEQPKFLIMRPLTHLYPNPTQPPGPLEPLRHKLVEKGQIRPFMHLFPNPTQPPGPSEPLRQKLVEKGQIRPFMHLFPNPTQPPGPSEPLRQKLVEKGQIRPFMHLFPNPTHPPGPSEPLRQ
ncbi:hypothetical protein BpHYR1_039588 [Brachionus plicatilis]|uniref:Uncharacterized protein n=1 Tax=Brachionus plicatilis TaxID=10195 RepID=A0A3M7QLQ5_BRAPC|nr:hypothetical protein BpHYR1_039588 [Brachionus plicatilis]